MGAATRQLVHSVVLNSRTCGECGIAFAMPDDKEKRCLEKGERFYCPNGHCRVFRDTENMKLRRELDEERQRKHDALVRLNESEQERAKVERKLKRVHAGVCPCCNRTFQNLARHMATKHAEGEAVKGELPADPPPVKRGRGRPRKN